MKLTPTICGNKRIYFPRRTLCDCGEPEPTRLPEYIRITTLPSKLQYTDGENISIGGIEVRAYYDDDTEWGIAPFEELNFLPTTAAEGDIWTSGDGVTAIKAQFMQQTVVAPDGVTQGAANLWNHLSIGQSSYHEIVREAYFYPYIRGNDDPQTIFLTKYNGLVYCASENPVPNAQCLYQFYTYVGTHGEYIWYPASATTVIKDYFTGTACRDRQSETQDGVVWDGIPESTKNPSGIGLDILHSTQTITVSWDRGDGVILTDTYEITVTA